MGGMRCEADTWPFSLLINNFDDMMIGVIGQRRRGKEEERLWWRSD